MAYFAGLSTAVERGIIIRGNFKANRISIGTPEEDRFVCKAMREIMANR